MMKKWAVANSEFICSCHRLSSRVYSQMRDRCMLWRVTWWEDHMMGGSPRVAHCSLMVEVMLLTPAPCKTYSICELCFNTVNSKVVKMISIFLSSYKLCYKDSIDSLNFDAVGSLEFTVRRDPDILGFCHFEKIIPVMECLLIILVL